MGRARIEPQRHLDPEIAAGLRDARQQMGWSLRVAARRIGLSLGMLAELGRGNRVPSKALAADLIAALPTLDPDIADELRAVAVPDRGRSSVYHLGRVRPHGEHPMTVQRWPT